MPYTKINWQNGEAGGTPLNATNLNKMDAQIDANTTAVATNTADIAEIKRNTEFNLTSASPLNGCSASSIVGIDVDGCSTQNVSANAFHASSKTENGITVTEQNDGGYKIVGTATANAFFNTLQSLTDGDYTMKVKLVGTISGGSVYARVRNSSNTIILDNSVSQATEKVVRGTLSSGAKTEITVGNGVTINAVLYVMLVKGSTEPTSYEKYTGTPTPTNPIAIVDASGDVTALHNIYNADDVVRGRYYTSNGSVVSNQNWGTVDVEVVPSASYKVVTKGAIWETPCTVWLDANKAFISVAFNRNASAIQTVTAPTNAKYLGVTICIGSSYKEEETLEVLEGNKITLPTLRSVGNVKDELIVNSDGSGQIIKRIGVETINGSTMDFREHSSGRGYALFNVSNNIDISGGASALVGISNMFMGVIQSAWSTTDAFVCTYSATNKGFVAPNRAMSKTDFQTLMNGKSFVFQYILATPTTTTLTASEVSAIRQLQTYSGTTIVDSALDVKSVTYHAGVKEYIDWRFEQLATLMLGEE